jgi:hypothetical protein
VHEKLGSDDDSFWSSLCQFVPSTSRNLRQVEARSKPEEQQNDSAFQIAEIYAFRNESEKAFEWLERAYRQRDGGLSLIKGDPLLRNIEHDPRYRPFLQKMKLPLD